MLMKVCACTGGGTCVDTRAGASGDARHHHRYNALHELCLRRVQYSRAMITSLSADARTCTVDFIDYGTTSKCDVDELRLLPVMLSRLPAQSWRCRLTAVRVPSRHCN